VKIEFPRRALSSRRSSKIFHLRDLSAVTFNHNHVSARSKTHLGCGISRNPLPPRGETLPFDQRSILEGDREDAKSNERARSNN